MNITCSGKTTVVVYFQKETDYRFYTFNQSLFFKTCLTKNKLSYNIVVDTIVVYTTIKEGLQWTRNFYRAYVLHKESGNAMTTYYDRNFAGMDISATQFSLMMNIKEIGKTNIKDLTNVVKLDKSTLTRTLAPLIEKGFIYSEQGRTAGR